MSSKTQTRNNMATANYTEDQVRDIARLKLHLEETESAKAGVGLDCYLHCYGYQEREREVCIQQQMDEGTDGKVGDHFTGEIRRNTRL